MRTRVADMTPEVVAYYRKLASEAPPMSDELIATLRMIFTPGPSAEGYVRPEARAAQEDGPRLPHGPSMPSSVPVPTKAVSSP